MARTSSGAWAAALLVLLVYGAWLAAAFWHGHDPRDFVELSAPPFVRCHDGPLIHRDPHYRYPAGGYDGEYYYFIATDPYRARCYLDDPAYRYTRILYPITSRVVALGEPSLVPWTLILVNLLSIAGGTLAIGMWLRRKGLSAWLALLYGFYPGLWVSLYQDLTEPLSYGLVALGVYLFDFAKGRRWFWGALCFALAALARETAVLFSVAYGAGFLFNREWRKGVTFLVAALAPFVGWKIWLRLWLGSFGTLTPDYRPFQGLLHYWPWTGERAVGALSLALPALFCVVMAVWALGKRLWTVEVASLLLNVLVLVVWLPIATWIGIGGADRAATGVILAALTCLPVFSRLVRDSRAWLWSCSILWFMPWYTFIQIALRWIEPVH